MVEQSMREFFQVSQTVTANLENELKDLLQTFSGDESKAGLVTNLLISKYSEKHRFYHNLSHINSLLFNAENLQNKFSDYDSVRFAIWFHDAVYEPKSSANEAESARLAVKNLTALNIPRTQIEKVEKMILATRKHAATSLDTDGKLFLDLDLGILGAPEEIYQKYTRAIRAEYSHVPEFLYKRGRAKVLNNFLDREIIYFAPETREMFEAQARYNIANEIKELS